MHGDTFPTALTSRFDADREPLREIALRMLGSGEEADEVLAGVRAELAGESGAPVARAWLAAYVGQACVRRLRGRTGPARADSGRRARTDSGHAVRGDAVREPPAGVDSVWLALLVVLECVDPAERLAYVLHDVFGLPPGEISRITGWPAGEAARLARRVRERLRGEGAGPAGQMPGRQRNGGTDRGGEARPARQRDGGVGGGGVMGVTPGRQRAVVGRFLAAARARDARGLAAVLDPEVVAYTEGGPVRGAPAVAEQAAAVVGRADAVRPALIGGKVGFVAFTAGRPVAAVACVLGGVSSISPARPARHPLGSDRIVALSVITGEDQVRGLDLTFPDG